MKNKKYVLFISIILIGVLSLIILNNKLDNKETVLDEVKLKENKVDKNSFAIMIQKEDKTGYDVYEENTWPTEGYTFNSELSGCIDNYGSIVENSMTYDKKTNKVTINTGVTSSCYLYFDLDKESPIVSATVNNNNSTNATITISSNETGTYCVNKSSTVTDMSNCTFNGNITKDATVTTSVFTTGGDYYVHVKDNAGNIGISSKATIALAPPLSEYIIDNSISGLEKSKIGTDTLYRFSGTTGNTGINNYICLGTTSKCDDGSDNMYRIIGVEPSTGYVKVIKQTKYGDNIKWNSSTGVTWPESDAYDAMTTWYNSVSFKNMIVSHSWNIGDVGDYDDNYYDDTYIGTRSTVMSYEDNTTTTAYVGMLALSDYYLAYRGDQNWYNSYSNYTSNWIHLANNGNTSDNEWTMSRSIIYSAWIVTYDGDVGDDIMTRPFAVRPVFYLNSTVNRISGSGTSGDPFIVE